jgi:hypothetical protein
MRSARESFSFESQCLLRSVSHTKWPERHYRDKANRMEFLQNSLELIEHYMLIYGYWAVFFGVMLENAGVPLPAKQSC